MFGRESGIHLKNIKNFKPVLPANQLLNVWMFFLSIFYRVVHYILNRNVYTHKKKQREVIIAQANE